MTKFVAVDGESYTVGESHRYVLMASSLPATLYDPNGISTTRCFEFLLDQGGRGRTVVAFGWNYDVNMILRDFDWRSLILLWRNGRVRWNGYHVEWVPNKWFALYRGKRGVKVNDVFGFFQTSFVNALEKWGVHTRPMIEEYKAKRSIFDPSMRRELVTYCLGECQSLVELMGRVDSALRDVDLELHSWVGAGAIAAALMKRHQVKASYRADDSYPAKVTEAIHRAYFGGRSELFNQGIFPEVWDYDIASAYPFEATLLPNLNGGKWRKVKEYEPSARYALWSCEWEVPRERILMPFPFRRKREILYPSRGRGTYHASEVRAARFHHGDNITIRGGWVFEPADDSRPFEFVRELFDYRRQLKAKQHGGEKVIKLGLNSIYGKLAQGIGYQGKPPPYQSLFWAGMITAGTRAKVFELAMRDVEALVMIATDGVFFSRQPPINHEMLTQELGGLELSLLRNAFVAQPGVYSATQNGGGEVGRTRGFFSREIDFKSLREGFVESGPAYVGHYRATRFCGLGSALVMSNMEAWRTWRETDRKLSLYPSRKFLADEGGEVIRHHPPTLPASAISEPYLVGQRPTMSETEADEMLEFIQGNEQPLKDF